ncbi:MAG: PTS system mannose/fructose/sorbose family transporter subunit IID [Gemmatimonadetes bacterium]|nr:PTS system mannose/fructose/sorbose family transporter subunit IID [Gemmatimonadota bacterium]MCH7714822.1 PTS system mannose/fructose/sorbose family transporter subunit IID [Gemmatimonadota bacterium]
MKPRLASAAVRLLVLQGSMNHERLQGIGAAVAIEPLIRDLDGGQNGQRYRAALARSAGFFNTNPYLAGVAIGAVARAEHSGAPLRQVETLRSAIKGPLGSLGDRLIWTGVLPVCASIGLVCATLVHPLVAVAAYLLAFNAVNVAVRWWGLRAGWRSGIAVAAMLSQSVLRRAVKFVGPLAVLSIGVALPVAAEMLTANFDTSVRVGTAGVALATAATSWFLMPSVGAARVGILALGSVLVLGWIW